MTGKKYKTLKVSPRQFASTYYDPKSVGSYGGVHNLKASTNATYDATKKWLVTQDAYTLYRPARQRLKSDPIVPEAVDSHWESDLADFQAMSKDNDGIKFVLVTVDVLSKYACAEPLTDKKGSTVAEAIDKIFRTSHRRPRYFRTDRGTEYLNGSVRSTFKKHDVIHILADHRTKASLAERFIRTLKTRLWRYFWATNSTRYVHVLRDFVESYNHTVHSVTRMRPVDVTVYNGEDVWRRLFGHLIKVSQRKHVSDLKVGDEVLISKHVPIFEKGYNRRWVNEIFRIYKVTGGLVGVFRYWLVDKRGENIVSSFKREELQKVNHREKIVRKVLKAKKGEKKRVLWRGYPDVLTSYVDV